MNDLYDVIIIGGGPAGYTAALYAARACLSVLVIEKISAGGQLTQTSQIENYPGFPNGIDGVTLGMKMQDGAEHFGAKTVFAEVLSVNLTDKIKRVEVSGAVYNAKTIIIAAGAEHKRLGIADEDLLIGKGISYCAACDAMFYKNKIVAVVGGGNSAVSGAITLSRIANIVYLIHRRDSVRASKIYHDPLFTADNVKFCWNSTVSRLIHNGRLTGAVIRDVNSGKEKKIELNGLFINIGSRPVTDIFKGQLDLDASGYIVADESTRTNIPGVYAAGDIRAKALRQIVTAASDGAVAAHFAEQYLLFTTENHGQKGEKA